MVHIYDMDTDMNISGTIQSFFMRLDTCCPMGLFITITLTLYKLAKLWQQNIVPCASGF